MITNVCLLLEVMTIVFCIHAIYGEKVKLNISTVSFLSIYKIIFTVANYYQLPQQFSFIMYPIMFIYCGIRFGFKIKYILINMIFCIIIVGGIQMVVMMPFGYILGIRWFSKLQLLVVDGLTFLLVSFLLPRCKINKITNNINNKVEPQNIVLFICILLITYWLFSYKEFTKLELNQAITLFISIVCIFVLAGQLTKYKIKAKEAETELKMHKLYADSFQGLIDNIRLRQHEFDNHINTLYSQHYIYETYDELVKAQDIYCKVITKENRFNKLLKASNPIISGFLYGKFVEIDKKGIDISYYVKIRELNVGIPVYKIVEIIGDLVNNAVEALEKTEGKSKLYISMTEGTKFEIEVRNESPFINYDEIELFFVKGYSKKGENRGLGLYNIKKICKEYALEIYCENIEIDNINWLSFKVVKNEVPKYN